MGEIDDVELELRSAVTNRPRAASSSRQPQAKGLAVPLGPFVDQVVDDHTVVSGGEDVRAAVARVRSMRCIQGSRVKITSIR